jgi:prepilin-type N-terminal cleavage/methylation domain-containing protein
MLTKYRSSKGFTLVEVLVVVVILAILAAIAVPIYLHYVESARAGEAQEAIGSVWAALKVDHAETGRWATNVNQLTRLNLDPIVKDRWTFNITAGGIGGISKIQATSTGKMPGGVGKTVVFDASQGKWSGYGTD